MRADRMRYYFPIGLFFLMLVDGSFSLLFSGSFFSGTVAIESRLMCLWLLMAVVYGNVEHVYFWSIIIGILWDSYYTGIIGVMMLILPLMVYVTKVCDEFFTPTFLVVLLIYLIDITVVTAALYVVNVMIGFTNASVVTFIGRTLGPTLAFNLACFVIGYFPLEKLFTKYSV